MARTRVGLNNLGCQDYFNNRRFAAQKEIDQRRNYRFKIKFYTTEQSCKCKKAWKYCKKDDH